MTQTHRLKAPGHNSFVSRLIMSEYFILVLSVLYFFLITAIVPSMMSVNNLKNIFSNMWPLFAIAIGQTFVLLLGGIDLSQTSVMAVTSVIGAAFMCNSANPAVLGKAPIWGWLITESGGPLAAMPAVTSTLIGIAIMLIIGTLIGFINGNLIARLNMPPFMVTLIAQMFYSALAIYITKSQNIMFLPETFENLGSEGIGFFPYSFFVAIFLATAAQLLLSLTILGRFIYTTGGNIHAARISGVPVVRTTVFVYAFSGFCAAIGSVLYSGRLMQGRPTMGSAMLLDIMAATIIGGTSTFGGKGKVSWTLYGVLFYTILATSLQQLKLDNFTINIVKGFVILAAATLDAVRSGIRRTKVSAVPGQVGKKAQDHG